LNQINGYNPAASSEASTTLLDTSIAPRDENCSFRDLMTIKKQGKTGLCSGFALHKPVNIGKNMRVFDEEEKQIIEKIIHGKGHARNLINIIDSHKNLQDTRIEIDKKNIKATFLFQIQAQEPTEEECNSAISKQMQLTELIIKYLVLFKFLEKEDLVVFFDPAKNDNEIISFGKGVVNLPTLSMSVDDQSIVELLIKYVHKEIMPSPALRVLANNKYVPDEERRFIRQLVAAWAAIIVSLFIGLYGVYNNIQSGKTQELQTKTQIQENRKIANSIIKKMDVIEASKIDYRPVFKEMLKKLQK
jgi:hypothetical protein